MKSVHWRQLGGVFSGDSYPSNFSVPEKPVFSNLAGGQITGTSINSIVVAAVTTPVTAENTGTMGNYKLTSADGTAAPDPAAPAVDMTVSGLTAGTSYDLLFVNELTLCGSPTDSAETAVADVCTRKQQGRI